MPDHRNRGGNRHGYGGRRDRPRAELPQFHSQWITDGLTDEAIKFADKAGKVLKDEGLTTSQIRNVYGEMKRIQLKGFDEQKTAFLLLRPKLAYAKARAKSSGMRLFEPILQQAFSAVQTKAHYQNLMDFMEAILAYHKAHGGK